MELSHISTKNTLENSVPVAPDSDYWKKNTWKDYHKTNKDFNIFIKELDKRDEMVFNVIHNIFGSVYVSINFSSKKLGFDDIFSCYTEDKKKQKTIDDTNKSYHAESNIFNKYVQGIQSFAGIPYGIICFHKCNEMLFKLCSISLMLHYTCIPNQFIKEFNTKIAASDRNCLFITKRTSGKLQHCILNSNSSIVFNKNVNKGEIGWIVYISFDNYDDNLKQSEIEKQENAIIKTKMGSLTKTVGLGDFLDYNFITTLTFEKSKYVTSLEKIFDKTFNNEGSEDEIPLFTPFDNFTNNTNEAYYNKYFKYIHENVKEYFLVKLDEYLESVKLSMLSQGVNLVIE